MLRSKLGRLIVVLPLLLTIPGCDSDDGESDDTFTACVAEGALVQTPAGPRLIESLAVGDTLISVDPASGERVPSTITNIVTATRECVLLHLPSGQLKCTPTHPLYDPDAEVFAPASEWIEGRRTALLQLSTDGPKRVVVDRVLLDGGMARVFDLTVDHQLHNFVADGVLVHNKLPPPTPTGTAADTELPPGDTTGEATDTAEPTTMGSSTGAAGSDSGTSTGTRGSSGSGGSGSSGSGPGSTTTSG